jgi:transposase
VTQEVGLQQILGVDKRNPQFSLFRNGSAPGMLYVFYGADLLEVVPEDKGHPQFKLLIARLYKAGVKAKALTDTFGVARTTMKRWGDALVSGDAKRLVRALAGPGAPRKLTREVVAFVELRFRDIWAQTHYDYSARMRREIRSVFDVEISTETLRPLFNRLKEQLRTETGDRDAEPPGGTPPVPEPKRANACDSASDPAGEALGQDGTKPAAGAASALDRQEDLRSGGVNNRNRSLVFCQDPSRAVFCHHAGVLLFGVALAALQTRLAGAAHIIKQWVAAVLLGAVNVEQTKLLNADALAALLGKHVRSLNLQREQLDELAGDENLRLLFQFNAETVGAHQTRDFYYDPHTKQYAGAAKLLKGWCPKVRRPDKALHMDFIHTAAGEPVFVEHADNFHDVRERFPQTITRFRQMMGFEDPTHLTFIVDRGLFKMELMTAARQAGNHIITWEKGYKRGHSHEGQVTQEFVMMRPRNSANDLRKYTFRFLDRPWKKDRSIRQIIVWATNPKGKTLEVSILATDPQRDAESIIRLMFKRWLQENDFKYLNSHFGINEITSYALLAYRELTALVEDKETKSGQFKALQLRKQEIQVRLGKALVQQHLGKTASALRQKKIQDLTRELHDLQTEMAQTQKEVSRLQSLIEQDFGRLDTRRKSLMDAVKILARNLFYQTLQPFRKTYDNYRDDHAVFRNLTRAHGWIAFGNDCVQVTLYPTMQYPSQLRRTVNAFLQRVNDTPPPMPDGSARTVRFRLHPKNEQIICD